MFEPGRLASLILVLVALAPIASIAAAQMICAGNIPPEGTVITATGTSDSCPGSCRARDTQPAQQSIMVICSGQPIPEGYELEGFTSVPACDCIGAQDNAYVIRRTVDFASSP